MKLKYIQKYGKRYRVSLVFEGKTLQKSFYFSTNGGKNASLKLAIKWRNNELGKHGLLARLDARQWQERINQNNPSVVIGVFRMLLKDQAYWVGHFSINGRQIKEVFSTEKFGEKGAFQLACKKRYQQRGTLRVINVGLCPCKPDSPYTVAETVD